MLIGVCDWLLGNCVGSYVWLMLCYCYVKNDIILKMVLCMIFFLVFFVFIIE